MENRVKQKGHHPEPGSSVSCPRRTPGKLSCQLPLSSTGLPGLSEGMFTSRGRLGLGLRFWKANPGSS